MTGMALVAVVVIGLFVLYNLGVFGALVKLVNVANREADKYDREHKAKTAKSYLSADVSFSAADLKKINDNIESIDKLKFD